MSIPTTIESLSTTAASNGPSGSDDRSTADDGLRQAYAFIKQTVSLGSNIASASTVTPPSTGSVFNITGTTSITTIASTNSWDGRVVTFIFAGALTLTHSSNLALPGSANITTVANDIASFVQTGSGAWRLAKYTSSGGRFAISSAGGFSLAAPSSGNTLSVTAGTAAYPYYATDGTVTGGMAFSSSKLQIGTSSSHAFEIFTANTVGLTVDASQNIIAKVNGTAPTLTSNSTMSFELTSNTSLKIAVRGTDGTTRTVSLTLA